MRQRQYTRRFAERQVENVPYDREAFDRYLIRLPQGSKVLSYVPIPGGGTRFLLELPPGVSLATLSLEEFLLKRISDWGGTNNGDK